MVINDISKNCKNEYDNSLFAFRINLLPIYNIAFSLFSLNNPLHFRKLLLTGFIFGLIFCRSSFKASNNTLESLSFSSTNKLDSKECVFNTT